VGEANSQPKWLVAERSPDEAVLQDVLSKNPRPGLRKRVVRYVRASHGYSGWRSYHYVTCYTQKPMIARSEQSSCWSWGLPSSPPSALWRGGT
jgi:hypothetical protein